MKINVVAIKRSTMCKICSLRRESGRDGARVWARGAKANEVRIML